MFDLAIGLRENIGINKYAIKLVESKQSPYGPIYVFNPVKLKTLKAYIKTHQKIGFIQPLKSPPGASMFFNKKPNSSLRLYVNYWVINNLIIKNQYPQSLISESEDWLGHTKQFIQLNLTSAYY